MYRGLLSYEVNSMQMLFIHLDLCKIDNKHVNDILQYTSTSNVPYWHTDLNRGVLTGQRKDYCENWYGYMWGNAIGSIKTTLYRNGRAKLNFGNCNQEGTVKVFLDNTEIATASGDEKRKTVEFDFNDGDELKLTEDHAIIVFNSFVVLSCTHTGK